MEGKNFCNMADILAYMEEKPENTVILQSLFKRTVINVTAGEFLREVKTWAAILLQRNLQNKHVAIMGKNSIEWFSAFCAITGIGATAVLLSRDLNSQEIAYALKKTDIDGIFFDQEVKQIVEEAICAWDCSTFCLQEIEREAVPKVLVDFSEVKVDPEDTMCILLTSGTTGDPKAVMLSNRAVMACITHYQNTFLKETTMHMTVMPLHHVGGISTSLAAFVKEDCCLGLVDGPMWFKRGMELMHPNSSFVVPLLLRWIANELDRTDRTYDLGGKLKFLICGGANLPIDILPVFKEKHIGIINIYGATESTGAIIIQNVTKGDPASIGKVYYAQAKILDGEILLAGDMIMTGYYKDEVETRQALKDGWYYTGDLGYVDQNGYYYLIGRKKNLIILSNGENVSPEELERHLLLCEDIEEVAVVEWNDQLCAVIYPNYIEKCNDVDKIQIQQNIQEFINDYNNRMPTYKQIYQLRFWEEPLPKNHMGKILRNQIHL